MTDWRDEFLSESIFYSQREQERVRRRARHEQPKPAETIIYKTPFVKYELPERNLMLTDAVIVEMTTNEWALLEMMFHRHVKETTQKLNLFSDTRGFPRKIVSVEPLTIWLPSGTMTIEERLYIEFDLHLPHIVLTS